MRSEHVSLLQPFLKILNPLLEHLLLDCLDTYPAAGHSRSRFFRSQNDLAKITVQKDLRNALKDAEAVIFAVPHALYLSLSADDIVEWAGKPLAIIDCYGILSDETIRRYFELGCEVKALGRGHVQTIKKEVLKQRI